MNPLYLLKHLQFLTESFSFKGSEVYFIKIYSQKKDGKYVAVHSPNEGISCVDDVARGIILALEIYEYFGRKEALEQAQKWLTFLEYMQDKDELITNFITDAKGQKKFDTSTSFGGGAWWSARSKWAWAKAYKLTKDKKYLDFYFKTKFSEDFLNGVASILLLAGFEISKEEDEKYLINLTERISSCRSDAGYFLHKENHPIHLWGYHQLEAITKAYSFFKDKKLLKSCEDTVGTLVEDVIKNDFYFEYISRAKSELNPYCISPLVRGLYELYLLTNNKKYLRLLKDCFTWFEKLYDPKTGRCYDWISDGKISSDCGAEASIEAGYCWVRKIKLGV